MFKNKIQSIGLSLLFGVLALAACKQDYEFPDPGFDIPNRDVELRLDTIDTYHVEIDMKVPNGLNNIEVLNGYNYDLIEEVNDYSGQTEFLFEYDIDLTSIEQDTILNYIFRVVDKEGRSFNKGLKLTVKQKSAPTIQLVGGDNVALALPAYLAKALVTTGLAPMESITISFEGNEVKTITFPADTAVYEYTLKEQVIVGQLNADQDYKLEITVTDRGIDFTTADGGHITREALSSAKEITLTKGSGEKVIPKMIVYNSTYDNSPVRLLIYANADSRIDSMALQYYSTFRRDYLDPRGAMVFSYNDMNMVDTLKFTYHTSTTTAKKKVFTYQEGTTQLEKIESWPIDATPETVQPSDITIEASNFSYNELNQPVSYFYEPSSYMVNDLRYTDPFGLGESIGIEYYEGNNNIESQAADRSYYDSFAPVYTPIYMPGLPPTFKFEGGTTIGNMINLLCYNPYLALEVKDSAGEIVREYTFTTNDDGYLGQVSWNELYRGYDTNYSYTVVYE